MPLPHFTQRIMGGMLSFGVLNSEPDILALSENLTVKGCLYKAQLQHMYLNQAPVAVGTYLKRKSKSPCHGGLRRGHFGGFGSVILTTPCL